VNYVPGLSFGVVGAHLALAEANVTGKYQSLNLTVNLFVNGAIHVNHSQFALAAGTVHNANPRHVAGWFVRAGYGNSALREQPAVEHVVYPRKGFLVLSHLANTANGDMAFQLQSSIHGCAQP
jgi:hypothetical protein